MGARVTDDVKTPAAPAPVATEPAPTRIIENPMTAWMRGGTMSSAYEQQLKQQDLQAKKARALEDSRRKAAELNPDNAKQHKHVVGGNKAFPGIVLEVREPRDNRVLDYIECELTAQEDGSLALIIACFSCFQKTGRNEQLTIRQNHRHFELDLRRSGELWVNPKNHQHIVTLAGTIHLTEAVTCPVCALRFVIDDSVVREK